MYGNNNMELKMVMNLTCTIDNVFRCLSIELHTLNSKQTD